MIAYYSVSLIYIAIKLACYLPDEVLSALMIKIYFIIIHLIN